MPLLSLSIHSKLPSSAVSTAFSCSVRDLRFLQSAAGTGHAVEEQRTCVCKRGVLLVSGMMGGVTVASSTWRVGRPKLCLSCRCARFGLVRSVEHVESALRVQERETCMCEDSEQS